MGQYIDCGCSRLPDESRSGHARQGWWTLVEAEAFSPGNYWDVCPTAASPSAWMRWQTARPPIGLKLRPRLDLDSTYFLFGKGNLDAQGRAKRDGPQPQLSC